MKHNFYKIPKFLTPFVIFFKHILCKLTHLEALKTILNFKHSQEKKKKMWKKSSR